MAIQYNTAQNSGVVEKRWSQGERGKRMTLSVGLDEIVMAGREPAFSKTRSLTELSVPNWYVSHYTQRSSYTTATYSNDHLLSVGQCLEDHLVLVCKMWWTS
jgi:hypothetical protein